MSAIAHWIENAGISTVVIGLIKPHLEKIKPPRALWVPFELGRPLGPPGNPEMQRQVLLKALSLVETSTQTVLTDFTLEDPRAEPDTTWIAPVCEGVSSVTEEVAALRENYQRYCVNKSRTAVGVAKEPVAELAELFDHVYHKNEFKTIRQDISEKLMFRFALDDLKCYYLEAALAHQSEPSSQQLYDWLWGKTLLGTRMRELRKRFMDHEDAKINDLGAKFIVPHAWRD